MQKIIGWSCISQKEFMQYFVKSNQKENARVSFLKTEKIITTYIFIALLYDSGIKSS